MVVKDGQPRRAEILSIRETKSGRQYYCNFDNFNKRLDEWVPLDRIDFSQDVEWPSLDKDKQKDKTKKTAAAAPGKKMPIPKKAQNKKAAWDFIQFLTLNKDMQLEAFRTLDAFPSLIEAQNDPFLDKPIEYLGGQTARKNWKIAADKIQAIAVDKYDPVAKDVVNAELDKVLEQNKDIKTALADAQTAIKKRVRR